LSPGTPQPAYLCDLLGITQAVITAEGDNQMLEIAAGRALATGSATFAPPAESHGRPVFELLTDRARHLTEAGTGRPTAACLDTADAAADEAGAAERHDPRDHQA
jgi:acyl-CoA oxidase